MPDSRSPGPTIRAFSQLGTAVQAVLVPACSDAPPARRADMLGPLGALCGLLLPDRHLGFPGGNAHYVNHSHRQYPDKRDQAPLDAADGQGRRNRPDGRKD
ncbi:MAG: hypothetical protein ACFB21_02015 [Opitutales bacterium]